MFVKKGRVPRAGGGAIIYIILLSLFEKYLYLIALKNRNLGIEKRKRINGPIAKRK